VREGKPSLTAVLVSAWRGLGGLDDPAVSHDPVAKLLVPAPLGAALRLAERHPALTRLGLRAAHALTGGLSRHLPLRTRAIDDALAREIAAGSRQVILLGAGLDARAYRLEALRPAQVWEVDHPDTQAMKRAAVDARAPLCARLSHVAVDFARDDLGAALHAAGFDPGSPSVVVWEGVTMYLERAALDGTRAALSALCAPGSLLVVTYYDSRTRPLRRLVHPLFALAGEAFRTRMDPRAFAEWLDAGGFVVESDAGDEEWAESYAGARVPLVMAERIAEARRVGTA
jgi:methyltransferase (TIGR00027 family)